MSLLNKHRLTWNLWLEKSHNSKEILGPHSLEWYRNNSLTWNGFSFSRKLLKLLIFLETRIGVIIFELAVAGTLSTVSILWGILPMHIVVCLHYAGTLANIICQALLQRGCFLRCCIKSQIFLVLQYQTVYKLPSTVLIIFILGWIVVFCLIFHIGVTVST